MKVAEKDIIRLEHLSKIYTENGAESVGIQDVNLSFSCSEFVILTGESGSGKTTLLNIIGAMDRFEEGELIFLDQNVSDFSDGKIESFCNNNIAFISQDINVIESITVRENVCLSYIGYGYDRDKEVTDILKKTGLSRIANKKVGKLSGGQKQRVSIARALISGKKIILADEPTAHLDEDNAREIAELLSDAAKTSLVIVSTHNRDCFDDFATREVHLDGGRVVSDTCLKKFESSDYTEISKEEIIKSDINKNNSLHIFKLACSFGIRLLLSKTKTALLVFMAFFWPGIFVMLFTGAFSLQMHKNLTADGKVFRGGDCRIVVTKRDGEKFTKQELIDLKTGYPSAVFYRCDILVDSGDRYTWYKYMDDPKKFEYYDTSGFNPPFIIDWQNYEKADYGRYPETESECMLSVPYALKNYYDKNCVGKKGIILNNVEYKIVGLKYYKDNSKQGKIILNKDGYDICSLMSCIGDGVKADYYIEKKDGEKNNKKGSSVRYSFDVEEGKILIRNDFADDLSTIKCKLQFVRNTVDEKTGSTKSVDIGNVFDEASIIFNDFEVMYWENGSLLINPLTLKQAFSDYMEENYNQLSLFFSDNKDAYKALKDLNSKGYFALDGNEKYKVSSEDAKDGVGLIIGAFIGEVFIIMIIGLVISFCFSKIMQAMKKDITVLRSSGVNKSFITKIIYVYFAIPFIISQAIIFITTYFIYYIPFVNRNLLWISPLNRSLLTAGVFVIAFLTIELYRKKYLNSSIIDAFRKDV